MLGSYSDAQLMKEYVLETEIFHLKVENEQLRKQIDDLLFEKVQKVMAARGGN